jgi:hypothetical protein
MKDDDISEFREEFFSRLERKNNITVLEEHGPQ